MTNGNDALMLLIDKPAGYSSARVVSIVKRKLRVSKAGHSGTLDPRASGLMIICTGKKTKELSALLDCEKEYEGVMVIGSVTKTFDTESEPVELRNTEDITLKKIEHAAQKLTGEIEQLPPMYSAVKFGGKPLYKYARKNKEVVRTPRKVYIKSFDILEFANPEVSFRVVCSKGTYIRSLVNDLGQILRTGAYLKELRRVRIGEYNVNRALKIEQLSIEN